MDRRKISGWLIACVLVSGMAVVACAEDPDPVGRAVLPDTTESFFPEHVETTRSVEDADEPRFPENTHEPVFPDEGDVPFFPGEVEALLPLAAELHHHGGSYLYEPLDVNGAMYARHHAHWTLLRLPENWKEPQPFSLPYEYIGSHFIEWDPRFTWFGDPGYQWEPRLVGYGLYEVFVALFEENGTRRDGIGHQLLLDFDLALTGTERIHVQFRPLGENNTGGSFLQLSDPAGYDDNSTGVPQRWWIEGELQSIIGRLFGDPTIQLDVNFTAGKFPFALHNFLLINDEITGVILGKNTITRTPLSNINVQAFYAFDEVDAFTNHADDLIGLHLTGDYRHAFLELSFVHVFSGGDSDRDADFVAFSGTQFFGPLSLAGRVLLKEGDQAGAGDGQLYVLESNLARRPSGWWYERTGVELAVSYLTLFRATSGWQPIAGGNFNRLRNVFVLNPLLQIAAGRPPAETAGAAVGVQLFRHHEDESWIPELAVEDRQGDTVWGLGLRYQRKLTARVFLELCGLKTWAALRELEREGVFLSTFVIF
jgi:hypothetical protein